jgi:hypothetical protein
MRRTGEAPETVMVPVTIWFAPITMPVKAATDGAVNVSELKVFAPFICLGFAPVLVNVTL